MFTLQSADVIEMNINIPVLSPFRRQKGTVVAFSYYEQYTIVNDGIFYIVYLIKLQTDREGFFLSFTEQNLLQKQEMGEQFTEFFKAKPMVNSYRNPNRS